MSIKQVLSPYRTQLLRNVCHCLWSCRISPFLSCATPILKITNVHRTLCVLRTADDYIYLYGHKPSNLYLELYPNREKNGRVKFSEEGIVWNLYFYILSDYPNRISEEDHIQEFGGRVIEELFQTLPCEKVLIKKYAPGEDRL